MIDLWVTCEAIVDHPHGCEENVLIPLEGRGVKLNGRGAIALATRTRLPEGWTVTRERGCPRVRCPRHSGATE